MSGEDFFTAWAVGLVWAFAGALALTALNFRQLGTHARLWAIVCVLLCLGIAVHQWGTMRGWIGGRFTMANVTAETWTYRVLWTAAALGAAGLATWEACRHRGWLALLVTAVLLGLGVAWAT